LSEPTLRAQIDAADAYEALFVPALFGPWAPRVADAAQIQPGHRVLVALLEQVAGRRAADALRAPFVLGDRNELARLFEDAGTASVEVTTHRGRAQFPSIHVMVEADLRGWLPVMGVFLGEEEISRLLREAQHALSAYATGEGRVVFESSGHVVTAMKAL
jgi:hypothetical protein